MLILPLLRWLLARCRPRRNFWLGRPLRATIARDTNGRYVLRIHYTQGTDWVCLPATMSMPAWRESAPPDDRQLAAVAAALADRSLARTTSWQIDTNADLCAPLTTTSRLNTGDPIHSGERRS
jgi:hypothetical protein